jgi:hypothetical protein
VLDSEKQLALGLAVFLQSLAHEKTFINRELRNLLNTLTDYASENNLKVQYLYNITHYTNRHKAIYSIALRAQELLTYVELGLDPEPYHHKVVRIHNYIVQFLDKFSSK